MAQRNRERSSGGRKGGPALLADAGFESRNVGRMAAAAFGTILIHLLMFLAVPKDFWKPVSSERRAVREFEVILEEAEEPEEEFVLTNPDVPSNPPDETTFFSSRDQQAAQEKEADEGNPSLPDVEGEEPEPTQNVVESETVPLTEEELEEILDWNPEFEELETLPERSIPGFREVEEEEGLEVPVTEEESIELREDPVIGVEVEEGEEKEEEVLEIAENESREEPEPVVPRPRPKLPQVSHGPVGEREGAAPRTGPVAVDANFSQYGDYLARMLDVIVRQWHYLAWESLPTGEVGSAVTVSFQVGSDGSIRELEVLESSAGLIGTLICQDAVEARQPYGEWTSDMVEVLGEEQLVRIRFHYR